MNWHKAQVMVDYPHLVVMDGDDDYLLTDGAHELRQKAISEGAQVLTVDDGTPEYDEQAIEQYINDQAKNYCEYHEHKLIKL